MKKETRHRIRKTTLRVIAGLLVALLPITFFLSRGEARYAILPYKTLVKIDRTSPKSSFLGEEEVVAQLPFALTDSVSSPVKIEELEHRLTENIAYIKRATVYISPSARTLNIRITERNPILRYYKGGKVFFLDDEGISVPGRIGVAADVPIAAGALTDSVITHTVYPLALYLSRSETFRTFFPYIDVLSDRQLHLYPRVGDYIFELHGVSDLPTDLEKVPIFYKKIVPQVGVEKYRLVKLSYRNQIVCVLRDAHQ